MKDEVIKRYMNGESSVDLEKIYNISNDTVLRWVRKSGGVVRKNSEYKKIYDEFTNLNVSKARKYQLRNLKRGKCMICSRPRVNKSYCEYHREYRRQRHG